MASCKYGDPFCPCQDGDMCHYEGPNPMKPIGENMTPNNELEKTNQKIQKPQTSNLTLAQRLQLNKIAKALLLDVSGSMMSECEPGCSRIEALRNIVSNLPAVGRIFAFNNSCHPCLKDAIPNPSGGTFMANAFEHIKAKGISQVVLITDGEANDKANALASVVGLTVEILYVGPGDTPEFLLKLAKVAGGKVCTKEDLSKQKELTGKLTLMLEAGSPGPIQL